MQIILEILKSKQFSIKWRFVSIISINKQLIIMGKIKSVSARKQESGYKMSVWMRAEIMNVKIGWIPAAVEFEAMPSAAMRHQYCDQSSGDRSLALCFAERYLHLADHTFNSNSWPMMTTGYNNFISLTISSNCMHSHMKTYCSLD